MKFDHVKEALKGYWLGYWLGVGHFQVKSLHELCIVGIFHAMICFYFLL